MKIDKKHKGMVVWLTGLPASGKSTIARLLKEEFSSQNIPSFILDGDILRKGINKDLDYSLAGRLENIRRASEIAKLFCEVGFFVIVSLISPYRAGRKKAKDTIGAKNFVEVFVDCPLQECMKRDPKGLYKKAQLGHIKHFTGISDPYENPIHPDIHLKTDSMSYQDCVQKVMDFLMKKGLSQKAGSAST